MPNLRVFTGNRLENLADRLAAVLEKPLSSPLTPETVVVPNQAMGRWLALRLAERFGVWANFRFLAPDELLTGVVRAVVPDAPDSSLFAPEVLTWRILKHLPALSGAPEIRHYLTDDPAGIKGLQLARKLAEAFELYGVFRPDLLLEWERGAESDWQAVLWRLLAQERPGAHKAAQLAEFLRRAPEAAPSPGSLPERVSVFGIATLAPIRLQVLATLARLTEVNLFVVNPSAAYWGQLVSPKEEARRRRRAHAGQGAEEDLHLEIGHPLLASLGRQGRDFLEELLETTDAAASEGDTCFVDPGETSLLACLQSDILNLRDRGAEGAPKTPLSPDDRSLQIHSCHSPMREVEVLHDHLLELFEQMPGLRPGDILVTTPDIEAYAPYVEAVFDGCPDPAQRIPFSIADRGARARSHAIDAFLRLLDLHGSRFGASAVLDLLEIPDVRRRWSLSTGDLETIHGWVEATRIRWGVDAEDRSRRGLPAFEENTWRAGLRRLLLGYALPGGDRRLFDGLLPFDDVEGGGARVLGGFADFAEDLFSAIDDLDRPKTLAQWALALQGLADRFLSPDDGGEREVQTLRRELARLAEVGRIAGLDEPLDLRVVRQHLRERLEQEAPGGGFLTGKVTFCNLRPLRSVPFRVIAMIGMGDGTFPRSSRPPGFDRMAAAPRRGDPSLRDEDRFLFLETLLSARERLYVSYVGQSVKDNSEAPPSVLISELLDAVQQGFETPGEKILDRHLTRHRLQAFSPAYFRGKAPLFSYSRENFAAVRARLGGTPATRPFLREPLPEPDPELRTVEVGRLASFLSHPARFFLIERLGVRLEREAYGIDDREPFEVDGLDRYQVEQELTLRVIEGSGLDEERDLLRARGVLPPARSGDAAFDALLAGARGLAGRVRPHLQGEELSPLDLDLRLGEFRLVGRLGGLWPGGLVRFRAANVKPKDRLRLWVEHLALCCAAPASYPTTSLLFGRDHGLSYRRPGDSPEHLGRLLDLYWAGLRSPVPLFPASSLEYAQKAGDPKTRDGALSAAHRKWAGSEFDRGEAAEMLDPYNALCFRGLAPLAGDFVRLSLEIFEPLLAHQEKP